MFEFGRSMDSHQSKKNDIITKQNDNYNKEYQQYFEHKITKAASGSNPINTESNINFNSMKYPKNSNDAQDSVEDIAANV